MNISAIIRYKGGGFRRHPSNHPQPRPPPLKGWRFFHPRGGGGGALRVAAIAAIPRTTTPPTTAPNRGGLNILNKLTPINES